MICPDSGVPSGADGSAPLLKRVVNGPVAVHSDPKLHARSGIRIAFSERGGGTSRAPFDSLNLAAHVGDDPDRVDENRDILLESLRLSSIRHALVTAQQVHGSNVHLVREGEQAHGAFARGSAPVSASDALVTAVPGVPLLMLYADCVPIILVAEDPVPAVAVVHSGWKGTLDRVVVRAAEMLVETSGARPSNLLGYIGPHIRPCCYDVGATLVSQFGKVFDTISAVDGRLDLEALVRESMVDAGMRSERIAGVELCTRDHTDRFFSYRAQQVTGRHGALAVISKVE